MLTVSFCYTSAWTTIHSYNTSYVAMSLYAIILACTSKKGWTPEITRCLKGKVKPVGKRALNRGYTLMYKEGALNNWSVQYHTFETDMWYNKKTKLSKYSRDWYTSHHLPKLIHIHFVKLYTILPNLRLNDLALSNRYESGDDILEENTTKYICAINVDNNKAESNLFILLKRTSYTRNCSWIKKSEEQEKDST